LQDSNELEKKQKSLRRENPTAFDALSKFLIRMEENLYWEGKLKHKSIEFIENFLDGTLEVDGFSIIFMRIYEKVNEKLQ